MTIKEITNMLGETISAIHGANNDKNELGAVVAKAEAEAAVAKQYFKGVEIILAADKMSGRADRIDKAIG